MFDQNRFFANLDVVIVAKQALLPNRNSQRLLDAQLRECELTFYRTCGKSLAFMNRSVRPGNKLVTLINKPALVSGVGTRRSEQSNDRKVIARNQSFT